jgi:sugar phosphate isomerase/epimerase
MTRRFALAPATVLPATLPEIVAIAARAGYEAVGLPLNAAGREGQPDFAPLDAAVLDETEARLAGEGVALFDAVGVALRAGTEVAAFDPLLDSAARLGAAQLTLTAWDPDEGRLAAAFADLCARAAQRRLGVCIEFLPWSAVRTLDAAARLVAASGAANGGVLLDCLHLFRSGGTLDTLRRHAATVRYVQICDAPAAPPGPAELMTEARRDRLNAGEGELPLPELFRMLPRELPVSVEGPMQSALPGQIRAEAGLAAARRLLDCVDAPGG